MRFVYYFGSDYSIYNSLLPIVKMKKNFQIAKGNSLKKNNFKNDIFILDDSFKNFLTAIKSFSKHNKDNVIVTTKKENISIEALQSLKVFVKPIKVLDLYEEVSKKTKIKHNNSNISLDKSSLSIINSKGVFIKLTEKEFKLIELFFYNYGKPIKKSFILQEVWSLETDKVDTLDTRVLETLISKIRRKIRAKNLSLTIVKSEKGYSLRS